MNMLMKMALRASIPLVVVGSLMGCASDESEPGSAAEAASGGDETAMAMAGGEHDHAGLEASGGPGFTEADVRFMQMMIGHHAQAIVMADMAPTHSANDDLLALSRKIEISQRDEILLMERWLETRDQPVPDETHIASMQMPGLLSTEQLEQLDAARGTEFDRLFLEFMIQHHLGAVEMVDELFATPGAGQDSDIFRFASDVGADQLDEIGVMDRMLDELDDTNSRSDTR